LNVGITTWKEIRAGLERSKCGGTTAWQGPSRSCEEHVR
jgi:hypothetical protein